MRKELQMLRTRMQETGIDAYLIMTDDFHGSEYVGDYFKCRNIYPDLPDRPAFCWS